MSGVRHFDQHGCEGLVLSSADDAILREPERARHLDDLYHTVRMLAVTGA